jgi:hypothetical protein
VNAGPTSLNRRATRDTDNHSTLFEREPQAMPEIVRRKPRRSPMARSALIDPQIKAWIDNVIVPSLVDQWLSHEVTV